MTSVAAPTLGSVVSAAAPVAAAIGIFGVVYGAAARPVLGSVLTMASSVILFSGAAQFTMVALVAAGATPVAVLGAVTTLALRHLPLGAVLQPLLSVGRARRALIAPFLTDETTGLALASGERAERTVAVSGGLAYCAWVTGTAVGLVGGSLAPAEPLAAALFPVLFVGLAALTAASRSDGARALLAGMASLGLLVVWPDAGALGAIAIAIAVSWAVKTP